MRSQHTPIAGVILGVVLTCVSCSKTTPTTPTTPDKPQPTLTSVTVTGASSVQAGSQTQLGARAGFSDGSAVDVTPSTWNSSQQSVATVSTSGLVTGVTVGSTNITAAFQGVTSAPFVFAVSAVAPVTVVADFTVSGGPNANQCGVSQSGSNDILKCTFDGRASTAPAGINRFDWEFPAGGTKFTDNPKTDVPIPCGNFADGDGITTKPVKLTITTPTGNATVTKSVTFVKAKAC